MGYSVFHRKCGCGRVLAHLEQCTPCTSLHRERAVAKAGPREPAKSGYKREAEYLYVNAYGVGIKVIADPSVPPGTLRLEPAVPAFKREYLDHMHDAMSYAGLGAQGHGNQTYQQQGVSNADLAAQQLAGLGMQQQMYPQTYQAALQKSADALAALGREKERRRLELATAKAELAGL